jgi:hypothetical protein
MAYTRKLLYEVRRSIDAATFTGSYQNLGSALANNASIVKLVNNSTVLVDISVDGVNDHDVAPANSFWLYDETANSPPESGSIYIQKGTQYRVKGSAGTGLVYLVVQYIQQV